MKKLFLAFLVSFLTITAFAQQPLWMRYNQISPKGDKIAFTYKGDIYIVDAQGGMARQLTTATSYDYYPIWSHDGSKIAFATDRNGNFDIYIVSADGGMAKRVTTNSANETPLAFSPDDNEIYYSAAIQKDANDAQFTSGWLTELYKLLKFSNQKYLPVREIFFISFSFDKTSSNKYQSTATSSFVYNTPPE